MATSEQFSSVCFSYQKETMNKIRQIETHQKSQDFQYFEVFEATSNNTKKISQLQVRVKNN